MINSKYFGTSLSCCKIHQYFKIRLLAYATIITPFRICFIENPSLGWIITNYLIDILFAVDIGLNFFSVVYDSDFNIIIDRKIMAKRYLQGWFWIDILSITPINLIFKTKNEFAPLCRLARLPKLYRLIKIKV